MQMTISAPELTVYYSLQCPFIPARIDTLRQYCADKGIPARFLPVDSLERAKSLPVCSTTGQFFIMDSLSQ